MLKGDTGSLRLNSLCRNVVEQYDEYHDDDPEHFCKGEQL